jgi:glycosyltransferase involved in cell wall biosynthesis
MDIKREVATGIIKKKDSKLKVLFEGWRLLQHSYGQVTAFQLIHLWKLYGPNGKYGHKIDFYVTEAPYYNPNWKNTQKLVYSEEYNNILKNMKEYNDEPVDVIYRQTYPYNINVSEENRDTPKCVFYTSEFAKINHGYFQLEKPDDLDASQYDEYISVFLKEFDNVYFTSPSVWSSKGMIKYLDNTENSPRNRIITHGVDTTIFYKHNSDTVRKEIRKTYNVKDTDILLINIGAMTTNKGILLTLEALHKLVNKLKKSQYKLLLKGSGDLYQCKEFLEAYFIQFKQKGVMTQAEIDNLYNHIIFTNKTLSYSKINDLFNAADLYISPYLAEGFGLTMMESLAAGLNVLVPRSGSTHEYMNDIYSNGGEDYIFYVDSEVVVDPNGLCQNNITMNNLMSTLLNNEEKFKIPKTPTTYTNMKQYIEKDYSWYKVAELLYDYLNDIVDKKLI